MSEEILVNVNPCEMRIALVEDHVLQEIYIERRGTKGLLGNIYKGRVSRLLPGIQAAFVDIGLERSAFLHVSDMDIAEKIKNEVPDFSHIDIRKLLTLGQEILVQVYKDHLRGKGARLTTRFTLASRFLAFTPGVFQISVSQKITDEIERQRLLNCITPSANGGYILRTAAMKASQTEIDADKTFLQNLWQEIEIKSRQVKPSSIVYQDIPLTLRLLRDIASAKVQKIYIDDEKTFQEMHEFAERYLPAFTKHLQYSLGNNALFDQYDIEKELQKALARKVSLKSGGYIVFDQTEAMTTIDVNTGSDVGNDSLAQTIFNTNLEASEVIARQVRLRNLGGIIIIDFIDMPDPHHQEQLLQSFKALLMKDSAKTQMSELTSLGLVQMTRKRTRESLENILCEPCPLCEKRGSIKSVATICYEIYRELQRIAKQYPWSGFLIKAAEKVIQELQSNSALLAGLEMLFSKPIQLQVEISYAQERYDILPLSEKG